MNKKLKILSIIILICAVGYGIFYISDYYHAQKTATDYLNGTDTVNVSEISNGLFIDGKGSEDALIFYPGAKVEYTSYIPLLTKLAENGIDCYLVEMPFNLAILGENSADEIIENSNYSGYYMAGHSLGGAMASSYAHDSKDVDGLILFAAYPADEINVPTLLIRGSNDKVLNMEKYNESISLLENNFTEKIIEGGNHAQFAYYGNQSGDGAAAISPSKQQNESVDAILDFIMINN